MARTNLKLDHFEIIICQNYTCGKEKSKFSHFEIRIGHINTLVNEAVKLEKSIDLVAATILQIQFLSVTL